MQGKNGRNYALARGEVYFDRFAPGTLNTTGEHYFGNTPEISTTTESEELEHFDSDHGVNEKDDAVTLSQDMTGSMTTDNIIADNLALLFRGSVATVSQASAPAQTDTFNDVKQGRYYQLGTTTNRPYGARHVTSVVVKVGATTVAMTGNYDVDLDLGRIYIELDAPGIAEGADITVEYAISAYTQDVIVSGADEIEGALRYIGYNPKGELMDYYWPRVKLSPNGDFALKSGEDWQTIPFNIEFLRKGSLQKLYVTTRGKTA